MYKPMQLTYTCSSSLRTIHDSIDINTIQIVSIIIIRCLPETVVPGVKDRAHGGIRYVQNLLHGSFSCYERFRPWFRDNSQPEKIDLII